MSSIRFDPVSDKSGTTYLVITDPEARTHEDCYTDPSGVYRRRVTALLRDVPATWQLLRKRLPEWDTGRRPGVEVRGKCLPLDMFQWERLRRYLDAYSAYYIHVDGKTISRYRCVAGGVELLEGGVVHEGPELSRRIFAVHPIDNKFMTQGEDGVWSYKGARLDEVLHPLSGGSA